MADKAARRATGRTRRTELEAVLKLYGLEHCSMAAVGADRLPEFVAWRLMIADASPPEYVDVATASKLPNDLLRIGETVLAERI